MDENQLKVGDIVVGKVTYLQAYGIFVRLKPGIDGLVHQTEVSWYNERIAGILKDKKLIGQEIKVKIISMDDEGRTMLSIKQLEQDTIDKRDKYLKKLQEGQIIKGKIARVQNYGIFVEFEFGIEGLVHVSEAAWTEKERRKMTYEFNNKEVGKEVNVKILYIEINEKKIPKVRIGLSIKQCKEKPRLVCK
ncbi:unnamed protein product [Cunninghamella blakesleeana]